jgi:hypothetical protein
VAGEAVGLDLELGFEPAGGFVGAERKRSKRSRMEWAARADYGRRVGLRGEADREGCGGAEECGLMEKAATGGTRHG